MAYLSEQALADMGFARLGRNVKISDKAAIYGAEQMEIGDHSRIDDFCVVSGRLSLGRNVFIGAGCLIAAGTPGIVFEDFVTLAYHVKVFTQSDDYSGGTLTNSTIPAKYKSETKLPLRLGRHAILGAGSMVLPGADLGEGVSLGAGAVVLRPADPWGIYVGNPARRLKDRKKDLLRLEAQYLADEG